MQEVYQSQFITHIYHSDKQILEAIWSNDDTMSEEEYRQEMLRYLESCEKHDAKASLVDTRLFQFIIVPETQEWTNITIFPGLQQQGIAKIAFLLPKELFSQVSVEQTIQEDANTESFQPSFFDNREAALAWLGENNY